MYECVYLCVKENFIRYTCIFESMFMQNKYTYGYAKYISTIHLPSLSFFYFLSLSLSLTHTGFYTHTHTNTVIICV